MALVLVPVGHDDGLTRKAPAKATKAGGGERARRGGKDDPAREPAEPSSPASAARPAGGETQADLIPPAGGC